MCSFHDISLVIITPSSFAFLTTSSWLPFTRIGWNSDCFLVREILSSLLFLLFSWTLLNPDHIVLCWSFSALFVYQYVCWQIIVYAGYQRKHIPGRILNHHTLPLPLCCCLCCHAITSVNNKLCRTLPLLHSLQILLLVHQTR